MEESPFPNCQFHPVILPDTMVERSVNVTGVSEQDGGAVKPAVGFGVMFTTLVLVFVQALSEVVVSETEYVPADAYVCDGLVTPDVKVSPKSQSLEVIVPQLTIVEES